LIAHCRSEKQVLSQNILYIKVHVQHI